MKRIVLVLVVIIGFMACNKDEKNTSLKHFSVENDEWFINLKTACSDDAVCKTYIIQALYNNDTVYYSSLTGALCDPVFSAILLNSDGEVVKEYNGSEDLTAYNSEVTYLATVYKCDEK
jgi:hypothetical protein